MKHTLPLMWICQQTECSLLGRKNSTVAPSTVSSQRTCDWRAVANAGVIGSYCFEDEDARAVIRHFRSFVSNITELPHTKTEWLWNWTLEHWFRQDGANVLTARAFKEVIREEYPDHVISLRCELPWPSRSPDLSASDHFLWEYLKEKVYTINRGPSMTLRSQFGSRFQRYQKTWRGVDRDIASKVVAAWV
jgi:hypothetical protein